MEFICFFMGLCVFAISAGIWGYWDYCREIKKAVILEAVIG